MRSDKARSALLCTYGDSLSGLFLINDTPARRTDIVARVRGKILLPVGSRVIAQGDRPFSSKPHAVQLHRSSA